MKNKDVMVCRITKSCIFRSVSSIFLQLWVALKFLNFEIIAWNRYLDAGYTLVIGGLMHLWDDASTLNCIVLNFNNLGKRSLLKILCEKEKMLGKQHFLLFPQCFLPLPQQISVFQSHVFVFHCF